MTYFLQPEQQLKTMKTFTVGITGHRVIPDSQKCRIAVREVIKEIHSMVLEKHQNPLMVLLSPLAEGADRIAASEWLDYPGFVLECPLPLEIDDYLTDFELETSRQKFLDLLEQSSKQIIIPPQQTREEAYRAVGHHVVDHSDLIIAVWDGLPPVNPSGTAAVVQYARSMNRPLYWVHAKEPQKVLKERVNGIKWK